MFKIFLDKKFIYINLAKRSSDQKTECSTKISNLKKKKKLKIKFNYHFYYLIGIS
jgi:hypothetical protein